MAMTADEQAYDVQVEFTVPEWHNRFWAVPVVGIVVKLILLIPHMHYPEHPGACRRIALPRHLDTGLVWRSLPVVGI